MPDTRRNFLKTVPAVLGAVFPAGAVSTCATTSLSPFEPQAGRISFDGSWQFRTDPEKIGLSRGWYKVVSTSSNWQSVEVPHTWQVAQDTAEYFGIAWYRRRFEVPPEWNDRTIRVEFEAVFHSASIWVNGTKAGEHLRKGYTAFDLDITPLLHPGPDNLLVVMVNSDFDSRMLPRGRSSDWTHDGGIYRPVSLLVTPRAYIERINVDAVPNLAEGTADLNISVVIRNTTDKSFKGALAVHAVEERSGCTVLKRSAQVRVPAGKSIAQNLPTYKVPHPRLWHFDSPNLYCLSAVITGNGISHDTSTTFGIRTIEVKDGSFWLNGERLTLMGVERMAGSNPTYGMAEPTSWIEHDHEDLKNLNCIFTRVHWPQDRRVLEYCDRQGILIQTEVPTWGPDTFKDMKDEPDPEIMQNGLEQLHEMIARDRNHPCIFSWGLCNEINGQNPPAYNFAKRMYEEAKKLDPRRLRSYASNSLESSPEKDVSKLMDFIEWNEYYESWYPGTPEDLRRNLVEIHRAFPDKPIVISEYGYCACTPDRPEGDSRRIEILRDHTRVFRESGHVTGLIFFCYNDYRTHIGDKGTGVMKQRIHGVVDLFGNRKPSYSALREESSPIELLRCSGHPDSFTLTLRTRESVPAYKLTGYKLRGILYGFSGTPVEYRETALPVLTPGQVVSVSLQFKEPGATRVEFDAVRPTGFSAFSSVWTPNPSRDT